MKDEKLAGFMGEVTTELKNIYRSLDEMKADMKSNHADSKATADSLRGILDAYQKACRQEDIDRDDRIKNISEWKKSMLDAELPKRMTDVETRQWKLAAGVTGLASLAGFVGSKLFDIFVYKK